ncbi:hypothetical protein EJ06DRAFT_340699 [Trichodelitschia bisporula]|uniref:Uncharacterized protein n=1 Tax=Trichodelitschia bisporula TaxID=703511 RepID=A0A6G1I319_9PEZI|nr:hypothetical protein EJ06DRAFT_340699 [Trichodelitschia bisporula]
MPVYIYARACAILVRRLHANRPVETAGIYESCVVSAPGRDGARGLLFTMLADCARGCGSPADEASVVFASSSPAGSSGAATWNFFGRPGSNALSCAAIAASTFWNGFFLYSALKLRSVVAGRSVGSNSNDSSTSMDLLRWCARVLAILYTVRGFHAVLRLLVR